MLDVSLKRVTLYVQAKALPTRRGLAVNVLTIGANGFVLDPS